MKDEGRKFEVVLGGAPVASFSSEKELLAVAPARIAEWDAMARRSASEAVRLALSCGALLLAVKERLPHGAFLAWLSTNCGSVSRATAERYMAFAQARAAELAAAGAGGEGGSGAPRQLAAGIDERSLTRLYRDYGITRAPEKWGGARPGAGRPAKGAAEEVEAAAKDPDLNWAEVSGYLKGIREFAVEADGFGTLADDDLESAVVILTEAAERARTLLAARREGEG